MLGSKWIYSMFTLKFPQRKAEDVLEKCSSNDVNITSHKVVSKDYLLEIPLYELDEKAYRYYRNNVKGNKNITFDMARRKLTRNIMMSSITASREEASGKVLYLYGQLQMLVVDGKRIVWIKNYPKDVRFYKDSKRYRELNILLGIKSKT